MNKEFLNGMYSHLSYATKVARVEVRETALILLHDLLVVTSFTLKLLRKHVTQLLALAFCYVYCRFHKEQGYYVYIERRFDSGKTFIAAATGNLRAHTLKLHKVFYDIR